MSPYNWYVTSERYLLMFYISSSGSIGSFDIDAPLGGVRPEISLLCR